MTDPSIEIPRLLRRITNLEKAFIMFKRKYEHVHPERSDGNYFYRQRVTLQRTEHENWELMIDPIESKGILSVTSADLEDIHNVIEQLIAWRKAQGE